jgi:hypothetical protein
VYYWKIFFSNDTLKKYFLKVVGDTLKSTEYEFDYGPLSLKPWLTLEPWLHVLKHLLSMSRSRRLLRPRADS